MKVLMGLVMTADGFPVAHHVFPGKTADIEAFQKALADLRRRFPLRRAIIVADRGAVSDKLIEALEGQKVSYILGMRLRKNKEVCKVVLGRAGRYREVADNLETKEVWVGERRYVVCHNPEGEERGRKRREEIVARARKELEKKGPQAFIMPWGLKRYVKVLGGELLLKEDIVREESRYDGKWVLRTNTELPAEEIAQAYKGLWRIERAFREVKSGLEVQPVFVYTEDHVRGHIMVCFLALVMEASFQRRLKDLGSSASYHEVLADLEQLRASRFEARGKAWLRRNELPGRSHEAFQAVGLRPPPRIQPLI